ncbi:MAG: response regulator, partial [Lachnospiraceae bacterium]|nr:response regulator [Lachnospiraceae bacterium]
MVCPSPVQVFLILPEVAGTEVSHVTDRILKVWGECEYSKHTDIRCEIESIEHLDKTEKKEEHKEHSEHTDWVVIVDDNKANLSIASLLLKKNGIKSSTLQSGQALLDFLKNEKPDLILLDVMMPEMDGFETFSRIRKMGGRVSKIPVIFLTAEENKEVEIEGITLGAIDFIRKPFIPEVLTARVKLAINLIRLQNHLEDEVNDRILENEQMSIHIIQSLADAIETKDLYTNGHSDRVALYSREIARRYGYSDKQIRDIYMMGLLHDVGKIGVPIAIINKPGKLTDEEFATIKTHPENGYKILNNIKEMPKLANGARWHHERYDGRGYPDGLAGDEIPEEVRIIAVADAYDAMTSNRSYREPMSQ